MGRIAGTGFAMVLALSAGGCASPGQIEHNADGTWSIRCAGGYHDWSGCHELARAVCRPQGFDIVSRVSNEGSSGVGTRDWSAEGSEVQRTLVIRCRDSGSPG